ncbi:MAG TPA: DinB family protein, partial [Bryobacteraceae bacterium]|nr:DinB family protein [Bryobacteraceae bacterium]
APRTKEQLIALLRDEGERYAQWLETLPDALLAEPMVMPAGITPSTKSRFEMLLGVKEHEMHHRAQLMLMQRMVGLVPHLTREMEARIAAMQANKATA